MRGGGLQRRQACRSGLHRDVDGQREGLREPGGEMTRASIGISMALAAGFIAGAFAYVSAQPPNRTGVTWTPLADVDLGPELGFAGRGLRSRLVTLPPGGVIPEHNHNDRPSVMYVV